MKEEKKAISYVLSCMRKEASTQKKFLAGKTVIDRLSRFTAHSKKVDVYKMSESKIKTKHKEQRWKAMLTLRRAFWSYTRLSLFYRRSQL